MREPRPYWYLKSNKMSALGFLEVNCDWSEVVNKCFGYGIAAGGGDLRATLPE